MNDFTTLAAAINAKLAQYPADEAQRIRESIFQVCTNVAEASTSKYGERVSSEEREMLERILRTIQPTAPIGVKPQRAPARGAVASPAQPWMKFEHVVRLPDGIPDSQVQPNMRFQFMFADEEMADRIMISVSPKHYAALNAAECFWRGFNPDGKFQIAWDRVRLSVAEGKDLMNHVVRSGGEIFEAFLD